LNCTNIFQIDGLVQHGTNVMVVPLNSVTKIVPFAALPLSPMSNDTDTK
jgi:hypothetical protein